MLIESSTRVDERDTFEYIPLSNSRSGIRKEFFEFFSSSRGERITVITLAKFRATRTGRCPDVQLDITQDFFTDAGREYARGWRVHRKGVEEEGKKGNRHVSLAYASNPGPPGSLRFDIIISISMVRRFVTLVLPVPLSISRTFPFGGNLSGKAHP